MHTHGVKKELDAIQNFLDDLLLMDSKKFELVTQIRDKIKLNAPNIGEQIKYGGIFFSHKSKDIGGIFVYKNHVSIEFSFGYTFDDPEKILQGSGKLRRHIKIRNIDDIEKYNINTYLKQMIKSST